MQSSEQRSDYLASTPSLLRDPFLPGILLHSSACFYSYSHSVSSYSSLSSSPPVCISVAAAAIVAALAASRLLAVGRFASMLSVSILLAFSLLALSILFTHSARIQCRFLPSPCARAVRVQALTDRLLASIVLASSLLASSLIAPSLFASSGILSQSIQSFCIQSRAQRLHPGTSSSSGIQVVASMRILAPGLSVPVAASLPVLAFALAAVSVIVAAGAIVTVVISGLSVFRLLAFRFFA